MLPICQTFLISSAAFNCVHLRLAVWVPLSWHSRASLSPLWLWFKASPSSVAFLASPLELIGADPTPALAYPTPVYFIGNPFLPVSSKLDWEFCEDSSFIHAPPPPVFIAPTECEDPANVSTVKTWAHYVLVDAPEAGNMIGSEAGV